MKRKKAPPLPQYDWSDRNILWIVYGIAFFVWLWFGVFGGHL